MWLPRCPKPRNVLYSKAETLRVEISNSRGAGDPVGRWLSHLDPILSESDWILSDASHIVGIEWCSLLPRPFLFTEARPACNQSRQTSTSCDLMEVTPPRRHPVASGHFLRLGITPRRMHLFGFRVAISSPGIPVAHASRKGSISHI